MLAVFAQMPQIVVQDLAIARRHPIVRHYALQGINYIVDLRSSESMSGEIALKLVEFLFRSHQPVFVAARERSGLHVIEVLSNFGKQMSPPMFSPESLLAIVIPVGTLRQGDSCEQ